nr:hypothetical protein [Thiohalocapsa halophila]
MVVHKVLETAKIDYVTAKFSPSNIAIVPLQHLPRIHQRLHNGALAGVVRPEQQRQWRKLNAHRLADAFEVFEGQGLEDHRDFRRVRWRLVFFGCIRVWPGERVADLL